MEHKFILKIACFVIFLVCLTGWAGPVAAENESDTETETVPEIFVLDAIVVTASKTEEPIEEIPKNVTVITREDIEKSGSKNVIDILAKEAGVAVRSASGNDKQAVVDIRGMGDTAASNVIVMVDDLPLNAADQSGPSISSVPVEQIERIEIVRGAGSVVYGNGAVGGVINIITRKKVEKPSATLYSAYGTDDTLTTRASFADNIKDVDINLNAGRHDSDGYRDNGFLRKKDLSAATRYPVNDRLSFMLSGMYYEDEYGLPGAVRFEDMDSSARRVLTEYPNDAGESTELRGRAGVDMNFQNWGQLTLNRGYISRDNTYVIGYSPQISRNDQKDDIEDDTRQLDLNYVKYYSLFDLRHMFQLGADHSATEYIRTDNPVGPRKNSDTESAGVFINNRWALSESLMVSAGARHNTYEGRFRTDENKLFDDVRMWVNGDTEKMTWDNSAYSLGATYAFTEETSVFTSYATSFRIPNVDEFAESEESLKPQEGVNLEVGGRQNFGSRMAVTIALFDIRIDDEIYYSDINRNYEDQTIRQGIETDVTINPTDSINLWGNYTFTDAEFDEKDTDIPLVSKHLASAGVNWQFAEKFQLAVSGTYSGSRYDGNDTDNNRYQKLDAYMVFDTKLTWQHKSWTIFAGVNNIFNELYSTSAYSEQYYPMPERNIFGGVRWTWL
ncbi:MAG: TonB-dependent receptor [Desulfosalsimonadaceae bacterium]|nr:TonB-dependent receptor [Desulfosalsimonadaceae bacterium]